MKITEYENEKALEIMADLLEPMAEILGNEDTKKVFQTQPKIKIASYILKNHSKSIIKILAILDDVPVDEYKGNIVSMTSKVVEIMNDEAFSDFFTSSIQGME